MPSNHVGFAAPAEEELADTITIGEHLIRHKESTYLLKVEGDSMQRAGIFSGDMVLFERGADPEPGDIVVALTEEGYVLRRLKEGRAEQVIGVVTASYRMYV